MHVNKSPVDLSAGLLQDAQYIADTMAAVIESVGAEAVDVVITDQGGGCVNAGKILEQKYVIVAGV